MYRLLIADDNRREREGIRDLLDWHEIGIEVAGMCENGKAALDFISREHIDIVISDIEMPVMNGLEFLNEINKRKLDIKTIFMSCYDEFDFAAAAIDLEASAYILKPIIKEKLVEAVQKLLNVYRIKSEEKNQREQLIQELNKSLPAIREQFFRNILFSGLSENESFDFVCYQVQEQLKYRVFTVVVEEIEDTDMLNHNDMFIAVCAAKDVLERRWHNFIPIIISNNMLACIVVYETNEEEKILDAIVESKRVLSETYSVQLSIGISSEGCAISDIHTLFGQSQQVIKMQLHSHEDKVILYDDIAASQKANFNNINLQALKERVKSIICEKSIPDIEFMLSEYLGDESLRYTTLYVKSFAYSLLNVLELTLIEFNLSFEDIIGRDAIWSKTLTFGIIPNVRVWLSDIFTAVINRIAENQKNRSLAVSNKIKKIVEEKYNKHITIEDIAETVHFSATHANNLFKEETGITIFDYLTRFRMNKAQELLKEKDSKIYVVSSAVGYKNKSHFCMLFKQYVGMSPMEYKNLAHL